MSDQNVDPTEEFPVLRTPGDSFIEESYLTYLVPSATDLDLEAAFSKLDRTKPILESIPQREALFFDETVDVLLVLRTPWLPKKELDSHINRLVISLEAHVANGDVPGRESQIASSESVFSGRLQEVADPFIIVEEQEQEQGDGGAEPEPEPEAVHHVYAMWKFPVLLSRPRMRLHSPSVVFSASASLRPEAPSSGSSNIYSPGVGYLASGQPSGLNLLESFCGDPSLNGVKPRLSALRVSLVAPVTQRQDVTTRLRALPQLSLRIFPVLHTRIRFSRPTAVPLSSALIALLEMDFTPHLGCEALLDAIDLSTDAGTVEDLNADAGLRLPLTCVAHDHITFLYHIKPLGSDSFPSSSTSSTSSLSAKLDISISALVKVAPGVCVPRLSMTWTTALDFSHSVTSPSLRLTHTPTASSSSAKPLQSPASVGPDALPTPEAAAAAAAAASSSLSPYTPPAMADLGITMSFTAPQGPIHPGDVFSWTVSILNRATDKTVRPPRKLAFVAVPKRRRSDTRLARPPSAGGPRRGERDMADAVMDDNILHALQRSAVVEATDLVCLSTDARVGPVAPGACHVVELHFMALREGIVGLEAIRVVDLTSQEHVDIRDLPTTIVTAAA